ncbi:hypothetical protein X769_14090 [Mesorhizobium sp. LSJC268A00]|nr:hypothetical protein X769_14090 [Mesorhizobium sp. LSJC268A00]
MRRKRTRVELGDFPWAPSSTMRDDAIDAAPAGGAFNELLEPADLARKHFSYGR